MQLYRKCYEVARLALSLGMSVLPPNEDGTKSPLIEVPPRSCEDPECIAAFEAGERKWKHRQHQRADEETLERWYLDDHHTGISIVCGEISDGLMLFEFEGRAVKDGTFDDFLDLAKESGLGGLVERIRQGYEEESPSGGIHWLFCCHEPVTLKLASTKVNGQWHPLIETKGEGGIVIISPSEGNVHPSGKPWRLVQGGLDTITDLTADELDSIYALARYFDEKPRKEFTPPGGASARSKGRPSDTFNQQSTWPEILEPHGWKRLSLAGDGWENWCRPGKMPTGTSASITPDGELLHVFTSSTIFEPDRSYSKFSAFALLNHADDEGNVDWKRAASQLAKNGFGTRPGKIDRGVAVVTAIADVQEEQVEWLWPERIPYGNLTTVAGDPGLGKSTVMLDIAARKSKGRKMPFCAGGGEPGVAILLTAEDALGNTVKPRLLAAGADIERVFVIEGVREEEGQIVQLISIPDDIPKVREVIREKGASLVVLDPLDAFLADDVNTHQNHSIRRALTPLKMLAEETGVAIVAICHLNKNATGSALYRVGGSIGNTGAARSVLLVAADPDDEDGRVLAGVKSNLSVLPQSLEFELERRDEDPVAHVKWDRLTDLTKDDLLNTKPAKAKQKAMDFLRDFLADGPKPVKKIEIEAEKSLISDRTLRRAAKELGIVKNHVDPPGGSWEWSLPDDVDELG